MMTDYSLVQKADEDLYVCQFGEESCAPGHSYGPAVRDHVLIHFVASGKGILTCCDKSYRVEAGQAFLILPDEECTYTADDQDPWHYAWIGFRGRKVLPFLHSIGIHSEIRVYPSCDAEEAWRTLDTLRKDARVLRLNKLASLGNLLRFLSLIAPSGDAEDESVSRQYCDRAIWFMEGRYDRDVSIQEAADFAGLSRSHLYRVMKAEYGVSPKEMLLRIRMRQACKLLSETTLTLDEIALRIGLRTGAQFGACFRGIYGITPGTFRKNHHLSEHKKNLRPE